MSLLSVREQFAELSGRHDLVTDFAAGTYTNNAGNIGADFFLDSGQRYLDRRAGDLKRYAWYKVDVAVGDYKKNFRYCNAIEEVWMADSDGDKWKLEKRDLDYIRSIYSGAYGDQSQGAPLYYAPLTVNLGPDQIALKTTDYTDEFTYDYEELLLADTAEHFLYKGVLWMPPIDEVATLSVKGRFASPPLTGTVSTYWTEVHPDILLLAGLWSLERFYRNTQGVNDYKIQIDEALSDLDKDGVEEQIQDLDQMWG